VKSYDSRQPAADAEDIIRGPDSPGSALHLHVPAQFGVVVAAAAPTPGL